MATEAKATRTLNKSRLTRQLRKLKEAIDDKYPAPDLKAALDSMNRCADELEESHDHYISLQGDTVNEAVEDAWLKEEISRTRQARKEALTALTALHASEAGKTPSKVKLKSLDYPVFGGDERKYKEWKREYLDIIKPRLTGASSAEVTMCLKSCLSDKVKDKLTPDCRKEEAILNELDRQFGAKDKIINKVLDEVLTMRNPRDNSPTEQAAFFRGILSAVNDLAELESEQCLKNPAVIMQLVRKLPEKTRSQWFETLYSADGTVVSDDEKPEKFLLFVKRQLHMADEACALEACASRKTSTTKYTHKQDNYI